MICPRCGKPVPIDPDLSYCKECRPQLPYIRNINEMLC